MGLLSFKTLSPQIKQYLLITGNYWAFTLTDGALRMLVVLYFHQLGYSPLNIAMLFLFYEIFGVITNLVGGWLGARLGLNKTMNIGLAIQIIALAMLAVPAEMLTIVYVMVAQASSGIAKDLNKMSAKSSIKLLVSDGAEGKLYHWIAILTGSKNALKGAGFFLGGLLLTLLEFKGAVIVMAALLSIVWVVSLIALREDLGKAKHKPKFSDIFSKSASINILSAARMFLFGARDVWFVVALPVFLAVKFNWDHWWVGGFMASWVIGYGIVQSFAPYFTGKRQGKTPTGKSAFLWASYLAIIPAFIALALHFNFHILASIIIGLIIFGVVFAINSSMHSYLIVSYAGNDGVSLDVGFYYMANAMGRLIGTVLSGWVYQNFGLEACLWISSLFVATAALLSLKLKQ
ncbi:organoarsenical effux MFS transporter ArsJ [Psychrosphaera sp. B3R10]|uniref:organoarsenical effux MFS transporter ArsJ n=1 Tax=unclassified Psychrosphaera TaxID=2641570 RepID=UPI001C09CDD5|nr:MULTISPECIES: organoarsenical effux MFS transporter ArsJ [unclassified Psychrosphaera]MBU2882361.1 organoarsenical effux MFS transporter ArsJ [Psychrosphaera sp. I2R16]MBU2989042.1 organoarsenical effux MFS transporter ArsJ [Psychrosphaera sp. B3R10]